MPCEKKTLKNVTYLNSSFLLLHGKLSSGIRLRILFTCGNRLKDVDVRKTDKNRSEIPHQSSYSRRRRRKTKGEEKENVQEKYPRQGCARWSLKAGAVWQNRARLRPWEGTSYFNTTLQHDEDSSITRWLAGRTVKLENRTYVQQGLSSRNADRIKRKDLSIKGTTCKGESIKL